MEVLLICGSLRDGSTNQAVIETITALSHDDVRATIYTELAELPPFNPDLDPVEGTPPEAVVSLRRQLGEASAVMFCTPEYAGALPGPLVNLLDWTVGGGETYGLPVGFVNVAGVALPTGGEGAHSSLRTILGYTGSELVEDACVRVPVSRSDVKEDGSIGNAEARIQIGEAFKALVAISEALLVKAFNNILAHHIPQLARPSDSPNRSALPIAGDDEGAKAQATELIGKLGFETFDAGSLADSWRFEPETTAYTRVYVADPSTPDDKLHESAAGPASAETLRSALESSERVRVADRIF